MIGRMLIERRKSKTVKMFDQEYLIRTAHNCDVHIDTGTYRFDIQIFRVYDDTGKAYWYCWAELRSVMQAKIPWDGFISGFSARRS